MGSRPRILAIGVALGSGHHQRDSGPPARPRSNLRPRSETEANQYIPFALEEVNLDFQTLGPAPKQHGRCRVLIAASRKEKVEDRVAVAESVGLKATVMDIDAFCLPERLN